MSVHALQPFHTGLSLGVSEVRLCLRRFSLWILLVLAFALGYVYCTPWVRLFAGDSPQSQTVPLARNSAYALSMAMVGLGLLLAPFVASISAEAAVRDRRVRLLPLALVTPIGRTTYLLAKCGAATMVSMAPLLAFLAGVALAQWWAPNPRLLLPANVVAPGAAFLQFGLPFVAAIAIISFSLSAWAAEPKRAYMVVTAIVIAELMLYATAGRPEFAWLSHVDPLGLLPLLDVGAGGLTNRELSAMRWPGGLTFSLNRLALLAIACLFLVPAIRGLASSGAQAPLARRRAWRMPAFMRAPATAIGRGLETLGQVILPGRLAQIVAVAGAELRLLRHEQSLLVFLPLFVVLVWLNMGQPIGPFNIEAIPITAILALQNLWIVLAALFVLGVFLTTEAALRDRDVKIHELLRLNPIAPAVVLGGKLLANAIVAALLLGAAALLVAVYQVVYDGGPFRITPIVDLYGGIALTTIVAGLCVALLVATLTQSRHASYAVLVVVLALYGYGWFYGYQHWLYNLPALDLFAYADAARFGLVASTIAIHRWYVLAIAGLVFWACVYLAARRDHVRRHGKIFWAAGAALALACVTLGGLIVSRIEDGAWSTATEAMRARYEQAAKPWLPARPQPQVVRMELDLDLHPEAQVFQLRGRHLLENTHAEALREVHVTVNPRLLANGTVALDGRPPETVAPGLLKFALDRPLAPGATATLEYRWTGRAPDGVPPHGDRYTAFVDEHGTLLTSMFGWGWLPAMGYASEAELMGRARRTYGLRARTVTEPFVAGDSSPVGYMRRSVPHWYHAKIRAPRAQRVASTGRLVGIKELGDRREYEYASTTPVYVVAVMAGRWAERTDGTNTVLYDPRHAYNVEQILRTMQASRSLYSSVFGAYPFTDLTVAEVPQMGVWAGIAFPGLIPLSDEIAFLTRESDRRANVNAFTVAHEIAHEWWGQTLFPAHARGAQSLIEGLATFSAIALVERSLGERRRRALFEDLEHYYLRNRRPDQETPLIEVEGTRGGDTASKYHRAGLVLSMLSRHVGDAQFLGILADFCTQYAFSRQHPTFLGLVRQIEARAPESRRFLDEYVRGTAVPRLRFSDVSTRQRADGRWVTTFTLTNQGTGTVEIDVAARSRRSGEARTRLTIGPGASTAGTIDSDVKPALLQFDPDVTVLLQNRSDSVYRF